MPVTDVQVFRSMRFRFDELARQLRVLFPGRAALASPWEPALLTARVRSLRGKLSSRREDADGAEDASTSLSAALGMLTLLLERAHSAPATLDAPRLHRALDALEERVSGGGDPSLRSVLPRLFSHLGPLRLQALDNPLEAVAFDVKDRWTDVGLLSQRKGRHRESRDADIRVIPFSVFTRKFFIDELPLFFPDDVSGRKSHGDPFSYHPENDRALALLEHFPILEGARGRFQYFIDASGLAEIVLDSRRIGPRELAFATRLFCLQNNVRRATLNGIRVAGTPGPPPR